MSHTGDKVSLLFLLADNFCFYFCGGHIDLSGILLYQKNTTKVPCGLNDPQCVQVIAEGQSNDS